MNTLPLHYDGEQLARARTGRGMSARLVCLLQPRSLHAENYYRLRHVVEGLRQADHGVVLGVTSPAAGDGKTLTAINLAGALAQNPAVSVLLVDLDLRKPKTGIDSYLNLAPETRGISDWILNPMLAGSDITTYMKEFNLYVVVAGTATATPYALLKSPRLQEFLNAARKRHDFVIVDTTQVLKLPDTQLLSGLVDGFLFVVRADHTQTGMVEDGLNLLEQNKVLGLVLNDNTSLR